MYIDPNQENNDFERMLALSNPDTQPVRVNTSMDEQTNTIETGDDEFIADDD